jgi:hypothetical protein
VLDIGYDDDLFYKEYFFRITMDDFEKEYPGFDWKNTPAYKHPGGKNCPCPKHEYIREQINFTKQVNKSGSDTAKVTLKFCPKLIGSQVHTALLSKLLPTVVNSMQFPKGARSTAGQSVLNPLVKQLLGAPPVSVKLTPFVVIL